jgi:hypothetical protein
MAQIIPVDDKLKQQKYCLLLGIPFDLSLMAYAAIQYGKIVGLCQFELSNDVCRIRDFAFDNSILKTPLPLMLLRSIVNFSDECMLNKVEMLAKNISKDLLISAGFSLCKDGRYQIILQNFSH